MKLWVGMCIPICVMWIIHKIGCFNWKYNVLVKISDSLLCATNFCIKVTSKLILLPVSELKFFTHYMSRVKINFYLLQVKVDSGWLIS